MTTTPGTQADDDLYGYTWDDWTAGKKLDRDQLDYLAGHELTTSTERQFLAADLARLQPQSVTDYWTGVQAARDELTSLYAETDQSLELG